MLGYYDQELDELDQGKSIIGYLRKASDAGENEIRAALIRGGFAYADHDRPVRVLSGGERARVLFVRLRLTAPNFLVLDEPTNHIDIEGREELEQQLHDSGATLLITSHDRRFIENIANRFLAIENGRLIELTDPSEFYQRLLNAQQEPARPPSAWAPDNAPKLGETSEELLEQLVELEQKLAADLARKSKHQKPRLQTVWRDAITAINERLT